MPNDKEIAQVLAYIYGHYPASPDLPAIAVNAWMEHLSDTPLPMLQAAANEYINQGHKFPPTWGQIRQLAFDLEDQATGVLDHGAAWELAAQAAMRYGYLRWEAAQADLPEIVWRALMQTFGSWRDFCTAEVSQGSTQFAQFRDVYNQNRTRAQARRRLMPGTLAVVQKHLENTGGQGIAGLIGGLTRKMEGKDELE